MKQVCDPRLIVDLSRCQFFSEWPATVDSAFTDLIQRLINLGSAKRLTTNEVLDHLSLTDTQDRLEYIQIQRLRLLG
ncbi:hypothetical protein BDV32DRAFT_124482 [Aspergillus pseudonomiae]|nr:hypothetical protein BDV32DRAFT_124482 [Aspergillus pseudonomiae]